MRLHGICAAIAAGMAMSAAGLAANLLTIDVNGLSVQSRNASGANVAFGGLTHTGSLALVNDPNSVLAGVGVNGFNAPITSGLSLTLTGVINLVNGMVTGGGFTITMSDGSSYTASIASGIGQVQIQAGQGFQVDGLTFNGFFGDNGNPGFVNRFAGVDITPWALGEPLAGSFLNFAFAPNANGVDMDADLDVYVETLIPAPLAGMAGSLGLLGVTTRRRR